MARSEFVQIGSYATEVEANYVCSLLNEQGIQAFVDGAASNTMMSYVGTALGGVRLLTSADSAAAAIEFLAGLEDDTPAPEGQWFCGECKETIDANFEICWACGKERGIVEAPAPKFEHEIDQTIDVGLDNEIVVGRPTAPSSNPYVPPGVSGSAAMENVTASSSDDIDAMVLRAYRASLFGFVLIPVVTHAYSLYLLLSLAGPQANMSAKSNRLWYVAFAITTLGCIIWIALFLLLMGF